MKPWQPLVELIKLIHKSKGANSNSPDNSEERDKSE
jgi:hypothetical protein